MPGRRDLRGMGIGMGTATDYFKKPKSTTNNESIVNQMVI
jgi:hypothetical protein